MKPTLALLACLACSSTAFAQASPEPAPAPAPPSPAAASGDVAGSAAAASSRRRTSVAKYRSWRTRIRPPARRPRPRRAALRPRPLRFGSRQRRGWRRRRVGRSHRPAHDRRRRPRNVSKDFSPSAAAIVRLYGNGGEGLTLGALGKFESTGRQRTGRRRGRERGRSRRPPVVRVGRLSISTSTRSTALGSATKGRVDSEGRLRIGYHLGTWARVGVDGQARVRVAGPLTLANGRFRGTSPQGRRCSPIRATSSGAATAGPTTMGLVSDKRSAGRRRLAVGGTTFRAALPAAATRPQGRKSDAPRAPPLLAGAKPARAGADLVLVRGADGPEITARLLRPRRRSCLPVPPVPGHVAVPIPPVGFSFGSPPAPVSS